MTHPQASCMDVNVNVPSENPQAMRTGPGMLRGRGRRPKKPAAAVKKPANPNPRARRSTKKKTPEDPDLVLAARGRLRQRGVKPNIPVEKMATSSQEPTSSQTSKVDSVSDGSQRGSNSLQNSQKRKRSNSKGTPVTRPGEKKPCPDTPGLVSAVTTVASTKDDALQILSVYLKSIKPLSEDQMLRKRREKLEKRELELAQGKEALQTLGLEIQGNYKKLTASKKASKDTAQKREIDKDIEKVTVGSRALIQIGQKLEVQKERLLVERKLLEEDEKTLRNAAKSLPSPVQF